MRLGIIFFLVWMSSSANVVRGQEPKRAVPNVTIGEVEALIAGVNRKVAPAAIFVQELHDKGHFGNTGAIVTADGYFLYFHEGLDGLALAVVLSDGRRVEAKALGSSRAWGISLGKLEEHGPWPFVSLDAPTIRAGQPIVTLAFALNEPLAGKEPFVDLTWVNRTSDGHWFSHDNGTRYEWQMRGGLAFDLEGKLLGIENATFPRHGTMYTHVGRVTALWQNLIQGKNVDQAQLDGNPIEEDREKKVRPIKPSTATEEKAIEASVRIQFIPGNPQAFVSGTIISPEGLIATCAHHFIMPGGKVNVALPDGRDVSATVVGLSFPADVGLIQITEPGPFVHAELGNSTTLEVGDACLIVGYGPVDRRARMPSLRHTKVVSPKSGRWSYMISTDPEAKTVGGDSGSGMFDADGKLIAFGPAGMSLPDWPNEHVRVEILRAQQEALRAKFDQSTESELAMLDRASMATAEQAKEWIVEILDQAKTVAFGSVVSVDGKILTKASMLPTAPNCRLSDGRILPAKILKTIRQHDVALLKIDATELTAVEWSDAESPSIGSQIIFVGNIPSLGTVAHSLKEFEGERGRLGATFRQTEQGLEVVDLNIEDFLPKEPAFSFGPQPLKKRDFLTHFEGSAINTLQELRDLIDIENDPIALAGDRVRLVVKRDGKPEELSMLLRPLDDFPLNGRTARCSGFPIAFGVLKAPQEMYFGGPVLDKNARAAGVAIAARQNGWILVLPANIAKKIAAE